MPRPEIGTLIPLIRKAPAEPYSRPSDWLPMPTLTAGQQKIVGLHAVFPYDSNFCAFTISGAYTVDWGDGSTPQNYSSGATAYHVFDYDDLSSDTECTRGYRQAIVTITQQTGQTLTSIDFGVKHNQSGLADGYSTGWLDVRVVGSNVSSCNFGGYDWNIEEYVVRNTMLEIFEFTGSNNITSFNEMFDGCSSLQSIPQLDTSSGTSFEAMFYSCYSLQSIPQLDTSSGTYFWAMFGGCYSLQSIPPLDTSSGTNFEAMFGVCTSLSSAPLQGTKVNISYSGCKLSRSALVAIFNGLATVTGKIITITGNWGASLLSAQDRAIATGKGWTIAG